MVWDFSGKSDWLARIILFAALASLSVFLPQSAGAEEIRTLTFDDQGEADASATNVYADIGITFPSGPIITLIEGARVPGGVGIGIRQPTRDPQCILEMRFRPGMDVRRVSFSVFFTQGRYFEAVAQDLFNRELDVTRLRDPRDFSTEKSMTLRAEEGGAAITRVRVIPPATCSIPVTIDNLEIEFAGDIGATPPIPDREPEPEPRMVTVSQYAAMEAQPVVINSGRVNDVSFHPENPNEVFVTTETGGLWKSSDGGSTWRSVDTLAVFNLMSVHHSRRRPSTIFVTANLDWQRFPLQSDSSVMRSGGGIWVSTDGGQNWRSPPQSVPQYSDPRFRPPGTTGPDDTAACPAMTEAFAISEDLETGKIYFGTGCGVAIYDARRGWSHAFITATSNARRVRSVTNVAALGRGVILANNGEDLLRSTDEGLTWNRIRPGRRPARIPASNNANLHSLSAFHGRPGRAVAITASRNTSRPGMGYTTDAGLTSQAVGVPSAVPGCGGMWEAYGHREGDGRDRLYVGTPCRTFEINVTVAENVPDGRSGRLRVDWRNPVRVDRDFSDSHADTRVLAVNLDENGRRQTGQFFLGNDGGLELRLPDSWTKVGSGPGGINALQVYDVEGQMNLANSRYTFAFGTQDNALWATINDRTFDSFSPDGAEGYDLQMQKGFGPRDANRWSYVACGPCALIVSRSGFDGRQTWPGAAMLDTAGNATFNRFAPAIMIEPQLIPSLRAHSFSSTVDGGFFGFTLNEGRTYLSTFPNGTVLAGATRFLGNPEPAGGLSNYHPISLGNTFRSSFQNIDDDTPEFVLRRFAADPSVFTDPAMGNFQSLGVQRFVFNTTAVLDVNPNDGDHLIASDVQNGDVRFSLDGGENWQPVDGLNALLFSHVERDRVVSRFAASDFSDPAQPRSLASAIKFSPFDPNLVLVGAHMGGAYISEDGGYTWSHVAKSEKIPNITDIDWKSNDEIYVASSGRGIWRSVRKAERLTLLDRSPEDTPASLLPGGVVVGPIGVAPSPGRRNSIRNVIAQGNSLQAVQGLEGAIKSKTIDSAIFAIGGEIKSTRQGERLAQRLVLSPGALIAI